MTREEQIKEYLQERNIPIDSLEANSIREGIEWADENPKKGLVSLDKVYEHLTYVLPHYVSSDYVNVILEGLHKAMEG